MNLSNSGRVVIVDDNLIEEGLPLIEIFSKNSIPFYYFSGNIKTLPLEPLCGIRFVFLDIELGTGSASGTEKSLASTATGVLRKIISKSNGPYAIIFWSKHSKDRDEHGITISETIIENCKKIGIMPIVSLDLEKSECKVDGECDFEIISSKIESLLYSLGAYSFFVEWENIVNKSSMDFINSISTGEKSADSTSWNNRLSLVLYKLFNAYSEEGDDFQIKDKMATIYHVLNRSFLDTIEVNCNISGHTFDLLNINSIDKHLFEAFFKLEQTIDCKYEISSDSNHYKLRQGEQTEKSLQKLKKKLNERINSIISPDSIAKLNSALFVNNYPPSVITTGNIYKIKNNCLKKIMTEKITTSTDQELVILLLTPRCDIAQKKAKVHRIVHGIMTNEKIDVQADCYFPIGPFWHTIDKKQKYILIDFQTITLLCESEINKLKLLLSVKRDLLFDLQSKAANHVNRLGNFQLS